uniref:Uncharacterized protein LOC104231525 n=1 Tax=Nicotiana sylvestris TaxID=4096 RepID=A0A1U7X7H0_NICSY|nr:PREDICTED: uncharacterized protein LOC104231525 [Nicotiana sylvestris]
MWEGSHGKDNQDGDFSKVPGEAIDMENGKTDLMSQVWETNEEDAPEPPAEIEELGPSITATKSEHRVADVVSSTLDAGQRIGIHISTDANDGSNMEEPGPSHSKVQRNKVWHLVPPPSDRIVIGTRWVFKNNLDEFENTIRNKAILVVQGYNQEEGIDYDDISSLVARMKAIIILITFASHMEFKLFQITLKSAFMNGYLKGEVFVKKRLWFECHKHPEYVFKLDKTLYGLKQSPRAWFYKTALNSADSPTFDFHIIVPLQIEYLIMRPVFVQNSARRVGKAKKNSDLKFPTTRPHRKAELDNAMKVSKEKKKKIKLVKNMMIDEEDVPPAVVIEVDNEDPAAETAPLVRKN